VKSPAYLRKRQRSAVFMSLLLFELILVILQLWLFVSALEGLLAHERTMAVPAAIVSLLCLAANTWMLIGVNRADHQRN
jgi:hypothetical protein